MKNADGLARPAKPHFFLDACNGCHKSSDGIAAMGKPTGSDKAAELFDGDLFVLRVDDEFRVRECNWFVGVPRDKHVEAINSHSEFICFVCAGRYQLSAARAMSNRDCITRSVGTG